MGLTKTLALCLYGVIEGFDVCERETMEKLEEKQEAIQLNVCK